MLILIVSNRPAADRGQEKTLVGWLKTAGNDIIVDVLNYAELDWSSCAQEWPHKYDGVVLGGFSKARDAKAAEAQSAALVGATVPLLGVCGGMQDICKGHAKATGYSGPIMTRISEQPVNKLENLDIPTLSIQGRIKYIRRWGVLPSAVPDHLEILSLDAAGQSVAAVRHRTMPVLGFQGHPEYSPDPVSTHCLISFFQIIQEYQEKREIQIHHFEQGSQIPETVSASQNVASNTTQHASDTDTAITNDNVDAREVWILTGAADANVRDVPEGRGRRSAVVANLKKGSSIDVLHHLGNDWVSIAAPAELKGLCTRLRHGSGNRVWSQSELPPVML